MVQAECPWLSQAQGPRFLPPVLDFCPLHLHCAILWHITSEGLGELFESDFAYTCTDKSPIKSMVGQVTQLVRQQKNLSTKLKKKNLNPITKKKPFRAFYHIYNFSPFYLYPLSPSPWVKSDGNLWFKIPWPNIQFKRRHLAEKKPKLF